MLYPMILNRPGTKDDIMEMFAKKIGTDIVTQESQTCGVLRTDFKEIYISKGHENEFGITLFAK
jgi:hypothetical protein